MEHLKLFMAIIGCTPAGRHTEQHDVFFGIGTSMKSLIGDMNTFWPEAEGRIHVDAWREVTRVDGHSIMVMPHDGITEIKEDNSMQLYFLNLGGYKKGEFEEYHYKMLVVADNSSIAIKQAKKTAFYKHTGFEGAVAHIDDKYGVGIDDVHILADILDVQYKERFRLLISEEPTRNTAEDQLHIGYFKLDKL